MIHSDHGEEFWEHHGFEHNHTLYDDVTKALLLVRPPDGAPHVTVTASPATLSDIGPTLLDYTGLPHQDFDGHSLRPDTKAKRRHRPIPIGDLMYDKEAWGVVLNNHKYIIETAPSRQMLFDLGTDPGEQNNLAADADLAPYVRALSMSHQTFADPGGVSKYPRAPNHLLSIYPPAIAAGIDPEAACRLCKSSPGERAKLRTDVGRVELSPDKTTDNDQDARRVLPTYCSETRTPQRNLRRHSGWNRLIPPPHEAARMNETNRYVVQMTWNY